MTAGILHGIGPPTFIASVYLDITHNSALLPEFVELVKYCKLNKIPLLCGIDSNAWSCLWNMDRENARGIELEDYFALQNIHVHNDGCKPTFFGNGQTIIDITISMGLKTKINNWHVSDEPPCSDHRRILFDIEMRNQAEKVKF